MISAVVLTRNSGKTLDRALASVKFCDEILIIDDASTDNSLEVVKKYTNHVIHRPLSGDFANQRNFGMREARHEWLLFVDADEVVSDELGEEIKDNITKNDFSAYYIKRRDHWWGRELHHGEVVEAYRTGFIRLMKKNSGKWVGEVHEEFQTDKPVGYLSSYLDHHPHPTVAEFTEEVNRYSTLRSRELLKNGYKPSIIEIIFVPFGKFIFTYFLKLGFADGAAGFAYSFFMSFHSFLTRAKAYQQNNLK